MSSQRRAKSNQNQLRFKARAGPYNGNLAARMVSAPVAQNRSSRQTGSNSTRYRECERIATVNGSEIFANVLSIPCNPGLASSFPWLSGHAILYESYTMHSITYRYKNLKGTGSPGNILMSFDYDTLDAPPATAIEQSQSTVWIDGAPWRIFELKVPCRTPKKLFTRGSTIPGTDLKTYDYGRLHVSAEGCTDDSAHGYLEVEYNVELSDKQSGGATSSTPASSTSLFSFRGATQTVAFAGVFPYNTIVTNPLGIISDGAGNFTLPPGTYQVTWQIYLYPDGPATTFAVFLNGVESTYAFPGFSNTTGGPAAQYTVVVGPFSTPTAFKLVRKSSSGSGTGTINWQSSATGDVQHVVFALA